MSEWARVANLGKAKNLKGGLLAYPREGLPFLLEEGMEVFFVPPVLRLPRKGRIIEVKEFSAGAYLVTFDTIQSIEEAEKLVGHHLLVRKRDLPEGYEHTLLDLVGFEVFLQPEGKLGVVAAIEENPAHPLLIVETSRGDTVQIPLVEDFIVSFDEEASTIELDLPEGLLDL